MLNDKEQNKYDIIKKVVDGTMTRKEAMFELNLSRQQVYRLVNLYKSKGKEGFINGNRGKSNPNKKDDELIQTLIDLYLEKHYYFNFQHFYEDYVLGKYDISYDVMLKRFTEDDVISPLAHKKTIKLYKDKMNEVIKENETNDNEEKLNFLNQEL